MTGSFMYARQFEEAPSSCVVYNPEAVIKLETTQTVSLTLSEDSNHITIE